MGKEIQTKGEKMNKKKVVLYTDHPDVMSACPVPKSYEHYKQYRESFLSKFIRMLKYRKIKD